MKNLNQNAGQWLDRYPYLKANVQFTNAVVYHWLDMPDTAEVLHNEALNLRKRIYGDSSREVADSYLWRGVLYNWGLQRKELAEESYRSAWELQKKYMPESRYALGSVYYGLANIAMENFRFDEALIFANEYLLLYHDIPYEQAFGKQLIANAYWGMRDHDKSLKYRREAINIYRRSGFKEDLIIEYGNLANDLTNLGRYEEAEQVLTRGQQILNTAHMKDPYHAIILYVNFGDLYRLMKKYASAEQYIERAMNIALRQYGERNNEVADIFSSHGEVMRDQLRFQDALLDFQRMLIAVIPGFSSTDYEVMPGIQSENPYFKNIISATFKKADAFLAWYGADHDPLHLEFALKNYKQAYAQIAEARRSIGDELSKPYLMSNFQESIENSIECARLQYNRTKDPALINDILYFVEFTKYLNVLDALDRSERANNSDVPVQILFRLDSTRNELNHLQRVELESKHFALSDDSLAKVRNKILNLIGERRDLVARIARYSLHDISAEKRVIPIEDVQTQLKRDEQILEFFWGKDTIYTISITSTSSSVNAIANDSEMNSLLKSIHGMLKNTPSYKPGAVHQYVASTYALHSKLFKPVVNREKLIIVPDGPLNLIPVEALVTDPKAVNHSFRDLAYMIHDHEISYAYSCSILFHKGDHPAAGNDKIEKVLAFSYSGDMKQSGRSMQDQRPVLPGTFSELETLSGIFSNVSRFTDKNALKGNFIKMARDHDLIHLGLHGIGDPEVADHSRLVFPSDSMNTSDLYAYEIYNMKIDAKLVVLSACETGIGKQQQGEGIFSIARAFRYAGCPSVVMSMWRVNDRFTASLMESFYKDLHAGNPLAASLRNAKRKFLETSTDFTSHPANWSAFVLNGNNQSFEVSRSYYTLILLLAGALLVWAAIKFRWISFLS
ncbi:MAG TPA: CHAT domain-containing tetratricopeptide repeat protein, partial [Chryseosolibacter sp.]